jgi:Transcription-silencing protein Clr2
MLADKRVARPAEQLLPSDEEGTLDIWKTLIQLLYRHRESRKLIDEDIEEKISPDWRAEHNEKYGDSFNILSSHLTHVLLQHSFVPRTGELVLWCPDHPDDLDIVYNPHIRGYQFYSAERQIFHGFPRWRAGVVTQCPSTDENLDFPDLLCVVGRKDSLNRAGFRVETFPDPNDNVEKSASKQYKYVPLRQIRPLNHWQKVLGGIPEKKLDPSIQYALTCMVSVSLLEKYRFTGKWPEASIFCKGIYIGAELLIEGDAVRILPQNQAATAGPAECTDVLVISSIRLHLRSINEEHIKNTSPRICSRSSITLVGKAYTLNPLRDYSQTSPMSPHGALPQPIATDTIKYALPTVGASAHGNWYALHGPGHKYEITHDRVLGRLHESGAVGMWSGTLGHHATSKTPPSLSHDLSSVLAGRRYGTLTDERIPETKGGTISWFWADTRVQALSLETVNGLEVGAYDPVRDLRTMQAWRARLKIIDGAYSLEDSKDSMLARQKGRPRGSRVVRGMVVGPDEESDENEEIDTPGKGSFSEAVRSVKGVGGMVGAGAALQGDDNEEDEDEDEGLSGELESDETDEEESATYPSKVSIMEQKPEWKSSSFIVPDDPDMDVRPIPPKKRSTSNLSPESLGPTKARKSAGGSRISSIYAGRYDSSVTPAMTRDMGSTRWKGKGRSDNVGVELDPDTPFRSVELDNAITIADDNEESNNEEEVEEAFYAPGGFVEPEPKDDDESDDDDDGVENEEEERIRTLASFQKQTFDRRGRKIAF